MRIFARSAALFPSKRKMVLLSRSYKKTYKSVIYGGCFGGGGGSVRREEKRREEKRREEKRREEKRKLRGMKVWGGGLGLDLDLGLDLGGG